MSKPPEILGPPVSYIDLLDDATNETIKAEAEAKKRKFHPLRPSSAGKCTRELAYELNEFAGRANYEKKSIGPEQHRLFKLGHSIEYHLLKEFAQHLDLLELKYKQQVVELFYLEAKVTPELSWLVEGSLDMCLWSAQYRGVADVKSKKDKFSAYYKTQWDEASDDLANMKSVVKVSDKCFWAEDLDAFLKELNDPFFESNFVQLNSYACSAFLRARGVDHAAIFQYNKNDSRLREVRFKPSMVVFEKTRAKFQAALDAVDQGNPELAPRDHSLGSIKCAFCPFTKQCWGEDGLQKWFETFPSKRWPTKIGTFRDNDLVSLFSKFENGLSAADDTSAIEQEILVKLGAAKTQKVKLDNGHVYEIKALKSPRPHLELRRSKA